MLMPGFGESYISPRIRLLLALAMTVVVQPVLPNVLPALPESPFALFLITGVTEGFTKVLEITGVGYRANSQGKTLKLQLGYSHDVDFAVPEGIEIKTPDNTTIEISGIDKQQVGQVAAAIRRWRKPEP